MKKVLIIVIALSSALFIINACKKTGDAANPFSDVNNFSIGSYLVLDSVINKNLHSEQAATSTVGIMVHSYPNGEEISSVILFAVKGDDWDTTKWHQVKTVSYTGAGTQLTVTGAELETAMGADFTPYVANDLYTIYTRVVTKSGKTYDVNNTGTNGGSGINGGESYNAAMSFTAYVTCPFTGGMAGNYKVVQDGLGEWNPGDIVHVQDGPGANQITIANVYPNPANGIVTNPIVVNITDPSVGGATVPQVNLGTYNNGNSLTLNPGSGYVFSCTGYITLSNEIFIDGADQGALNLILQKQ
ncbi:MAG: hypothetical protein LBE82_03860 [Chitinophagaceae bacterium]|jgi:hypothetical protein|nr:hypothetical protein [Chitinophagaceae bacterium]